ncbi:glutamate racemase [Azotosporobacter soli]|uniref:glutamate racemase n=1 Tax=Azotosporobacter soli TaxID=3055040 RepID=UPI0031FE469B
MTDDKKNLPIGVFDSGIGGLTVVKELRALLPGEDIIYFGDTARVPYGPRPPQQILTFMQQILRFFAAQPVKLAVVACNTMTALGVEANQGRFAFPLVGVDTGMAAALNYGTKVGLLATQATVTSGKHAEKARLFNARAEVTGVPCHDFVPLIEGGQLSGPAVEAAVASYLAPLCQAGVSSLVLGCTHYPLLTPLIREKVGDAMAIINPALETATAAQEVLRQQALLAGPARKGATRLCFSALTEQVRMMATQILDGECSLEEVELPD